MSSLPPHLQPADPCHAPMPMIVGVPRSGTTLLRFMLDSHPLVAIPPETGFLAFASKFWTLRCMKGFAAREALFRIVTRLPLKSGPWQDFGIDADEFREELRQIEPFDVGEGFRAFYRLYARKQKKPRYGDKTPLYCLHLRDIEKILPEAHFIHVIRDGRDVALSLRPMWFAPAQDMRTLAQYWSKLVRNTRETGRQSHAYLEVHYEELIKDSSAVLQSVCGFLNIVFDPAMLRYWERTSERLSEHQTRHGFHGRAVITHDRRLVQQRLTMHPPQLERAFCWKKKMTPDEHSEFVRYGGKMLSEFGYGS